MPHLAALGGHCGHWVGIWWLGDARERREGQEKMGFREGRRGPAALLHALQGPASITKLSVRIRLNKDFATSNLAAAHTILAAGCRNEPNLTVYSLQGHLITNEL